MEKEIEFRAYNAHNNKMIFGPTDDNPNSSWVLVCAQANELPLMEYTNAKANNDVKIFKGDIVKIDRYDESLIGEVKQLKGGQYYIDHPKVSLKYMHQIHCEVCDTESPVFFLDFFDAYELEVIGNVFQNPDKNRNPTV